MMKTKATSSRLTMTRRRTLQVASAGPSALSLQIQTLIRAVAYPCRTPTEAVAGTLSAGFFVVLNSERARRHMHTDRSY